MDKLIVGELPRDSAAFCYFHGLWQKSRGRNPSEGWGKTRNPRVAFDLANDLAKTLLQVFGEVAEADEQKVVSICVLDPNLKSPAVMVDLYVLLAGFANISGWLRRFEKWLTELEVAADDTTWDFFREEICDGRIRVGAQRRQEGRIVLGVARRERPRDNEPGTLTVDQLSATIEQMAAASVEFGGAPMPFTPKMAYLYKSDTWHPRDLATLEQLYPGLSQEARTLEVGDVTDIPGEPAYLVLEKIYNGSVDLMIQVPEALAFVDPRSDQEETPSGDGDGTDN